jgi:23S rRNA (cytidine1920-2'-O)/16S rRNA (cytidine1409-2'-O)-methyltransferase
VTRRRLDAELVRRGLASSRAEARDAVAAGLVSVAGAPATKAASMVADDAALSLSGPPRRFVSRGGAKLQAALDRWAIDPEGLDCLDAGASTGGFTDCLLRAGAARVLAVDVGYGQLAWELRTDERVEVLERTNVRTLTAEQIPFAPSLVVADLSFISLRLVAQTLVRIAAPDATFLVLVKPQFEAGPQDVRRGGVVRDPMVWGRVVNEVAQVFGTAGAPATRAMASPIVGPAGNVEFLLWARSGMGPAADLDVAGIVAEGEAVRSA